MRKEKKRRIRVALVGLGNCAGSLVEGVALYTKRRGTDGLLFPTLGGYRVSDIEIACAFDVNKHKVGRPIKDAIYQSPNNFARFPEAKVSSLAPTLRGPTLDGNPTHLAIFVEESPKKPVDVAKELKRYAVDVVVNLLPTGSVEATEYYGMAAFEAGAAFINCIPTVFAQRDEVAKKFGAKGIPIVGDDIKSQVGSTIIHRAMLQMLSDRGAKIVRSSQINIGGNTDFANFVHRAGTKLVSKYKSLKMFIDERTPNHIGHHYDVTKGPYKKTLFDIEATVFGGSPVRISITLQSDDKPNSAGSIIDLIRIAARERELGHGGVIKEAAAYYMKSAPLPMKDRDAFRLVGELWG